MGAWERGGIPPAPDDEVNYPGYIEQEEASSKRKFYETTFTVTVLSEEPLDGDGEYDLEALHYIITDGDCVGGIVSSGSQERSGQEMAQLLIAQNADPGFFNLTDEGDYLEEDLEC